METEEIVLGQLTNPPGQIPQALNTEALGARGEGDRCLPVSPYSAPRVPETSREREAGGRSVRVAEEFGGGGDGC